MRYILASYGRHDLQITLESLTREALSQIELWVVQSQYDLYRKGWYANKVKTIQCWPEYIDCIPKKRQWMLKNAGDDYMILDDDAALMVWDSRADRYVKPIDNPKLFNRRFLEQMPELFERYDGVSATTKFMAEPAIRENGLISENAIGFVVSGFSERVNWKKLDRLYKTFFFTDIAVPLQIFQKSHSSVIYRGICYNQSTRAALQATGTNEYRTDFLKLDSALKMAQLFPGIVTGATENGNNGGGMTITKFFSRVTKGVSTKNIQASEDFVVAACKQHGLKRPPKIITYADETPRDEIFRTFKDEWAKAKRSPE